MSHSSISRRPSSLKHPMRSSTSRISLVGDNGSLEPKIDVMYGTTNNAKEFGWFDHLLGVFCIARRPRFESVETTVSRRAPDYNEREVRNTVDGETNVITNCNLRTTSILDLPGFFRSTSFRLKGTSTDISYRKKPNVPLTLGICRATLYLGRFSSTYSVTRRQTSMS